MLNAPADTYMPMRGQLSGIGLGYGLEDRWFESQQELGIFLLITAFKSSGVHLGSYPMGTKGSFLRGKAAGA
jgi:hypothetical protein